MPERPSIAQAMWPTLRSNSPEALAKEAAQAKEQAWREQSRQSLLRGLRELNESLRADRERR
jgi:hypothetical protein